jgi:hypothetical protein
MATPFFVTRPNQTNKLAPAKPALPGQNVQNIPKPADWHPAETEPSQTLPANWTADTTKTDLSSTALAKLIADQEPFFTESLKAIEDNILNLEQVKQYLIRARDSWKNKETTPPTV